MVKRSKPYHWVSQQLEVTRAVAAGKSGCLVAIGSDLKVLIDGLTSAMHSVKIRRATLHWSITSNATRPGMALAATPGIIEANSGTSFNNFDLTSELAIEDDLSTYVDNVGAARIGRTQTLKRGSDSYLSGSMNITKECASYARRSGEQPLDYNEAPELGTFLHVKCNQSTTLYYNAFVVLEYEKLLRPEIW